MPLVVSFLLGTAFTEYDRSVDVIMMRISAADEIERLREVSRKLAAAGKDLRTWAVAYNEQIANGGRAASGAIAEFDELLKFYATHSHSTNAKGEL